MLIKDLMSKEVITVEVGDSMMHAVNLLKKSAISILPVMERAKLVGIITDDDLKRASASDATTLETPEIYQIKVREIMTKDPITVPLDSTVEETARILLMNKIPGVPVVDGQNQIAGIMTLQKLFRVLFSCLILGFFPSKPRSKVAVI